MRSGREGSLPPAFRVLGQVTLETYFGGYDDEYASAESTGSPIDYGYESVGIIQPVEWY